MKIRIDEDKCVGAGQCTLVAPKVFDQREEDGIVVLLDESPASDQQENAREAAFLCPAHVIEIES